MIVVIELCNKQARNDATAVVGMLQRFNLRALRCAFSGHVDSQCIESPDYCRYYISAVERFTRVFCLGKLM